MVPIRRVPPYRVFVHNVHFTGHGVCSQSLGTIHQFVPVHEGRNIGVNGSSKWIKLSPNRNWDRPHRYCFRAQILGGIQSHWIQQKWIGKVKVPLVSIRAMFRFRSITTKPFNGGYQTKPVISSLMMASKSFPATILGRTTVKHLNR